MMPRTLASILFFIIATARPHLAQNLYIEGVKLTLGMPEEEAKKALSDFKFVRMGESGFVVGKNNEEKKLYETFGVIGFTNEKLTFISADTNTKDRSDDKEFSAAMGIYTAIKNAISATDSDGTKRTKAEIVVSDHDVSSPFFGRLNSIDLWIEGKKVTLSICDSQNFKSVNLSTSVRLE